MVAQALRKRQKRREKNGKKGKNVLTAWNCLLRQMRCMNSKLVGSPATCTARTARAARAAWIAAQCDEAGRAAGCAWLSCSPPSCGGQV